MKFPTSLIERARDIHSDRPRHCFNLDKVGGIGLKVPIKVDEFVLLGNVNVYANLPGSRRGIDLSRQNYVIYKTATSAGSPEEFVLLSTKELLEAIPYSDFVEVSVEVDIPKNETNAFGSYKTIISSYLSRRGERRNRTRVELIGTTACPCTQELIRTYLADISENASIIATHTQRSIGTLDVTLKEDHINHREMAEIVEESMSSPTRTLTKRPEEVSLVIDSICNPKFAEDVVRDMLFLLLERFSWMPDDAYVFSSVRSLESIHKHDIYAERSAFVADLRRELEGDKSP
ncbi:MAG: GTP cyclohydrolase, FolE2/MptA family [Candidatus Methanodesulfokora sp.]|jgi:GTP cyclohydrolase-4